MFWSKKNPNDLLLDSVQEAKNFIEQLALLQAMDVRFSMLGRLTEEPTNLKKTVAYIYFDNVVFACMPTINEEQKEIIKSYLRDAALAAIEGVGGKQFRTYAAEETKFLGIAGRPTHSGEFLDFFETVPVFHTIIISKLEKQISELFELRAGKKEYLEQVKKHLGDLVTDEELLKSFEAPAEIKFVSCGGCNGSEILENINIREDAKLYLYNTNQRRTADDLDIYSCICFDCGTITEFSFDPYNFSGNATEGIEYFRSYLVDRNSLKQIFEQMRNMGHMDPILRLIANHPDKLE